MDPISYPNTREGTSVVMLPQRVVDVARRTAWIVLLSSSFLTVSSRAQAQSAEALVPEETAPLVRVVDVRVEGNQTVAADRILSKLTTRADRPYYEDVVKQDIDRLYASNWFYDVKADVKEADGGIIVTFRVTERPIMQEVVFQGNTIRKFSTKKLMEKTGLRAGKSMDPGLVRVAAKQVERDYHEAGYPFAEVELVEGGEIGDRRVLMRITEGPLTRITSVNFEGAEFVSGSRLKTNLDNKEAWGSKIGMPFYGGKWNRDALKQDVVKLIEYYRSHGYLDVKCSPRYEWSEDKSEVGIVYMVEEGPRYKVRSVNFAGNKAFDTDQLKTDLQLTSGEVLSRINLEKDMNKIREAYGKQGYVHAAVNVEQRYTEQPGEVDLYFQVSEDQPKRIGRVTIEGNEITKGGVVRQLADLEPGQLADTTELRKAETRLAAPRIFEVNPASGVVPTVEFDPNSDPNSEYQDIRIRVQEAQTGQLMLGAGVNSNSGVGGSLVISERNFDIFGIPTSWSDIREGRAFRGAGQELRVEAIPGNLVHRYSVTFREPRLFGTQYSLTTSGYYYRRLFQSWTEQRTGGRFGVGRQFTRQIGANLTYRIEDVEISNARVPTPQDLQDALGSSLINSVRLGVMHDTRDSALRPSQGHYIELGYEQAFGDYTFPRATVEGRQYFNLYERPDGSGKHVLGVKGEFGYTGDDTPIFERFYAGGFGSLRGFQFRGVSPTDLGVEIGGQFQFLTSVEYQFPITADDSFGGVIFVDAGTVERELEFNDFRIAPGFGLRIAIPGMGPVPLAFDFAFPIASNPTDDEQIFSFSVGWFN